MAKDERAAKAMDKNTIISLRMPKSMKLRLEELAAQDDRTLSNYIKLALKRHIKDELWE